MHNEELGISLPQKCRLCQEQRHLSKVFVIYCTISQCLYTFISVQITLRDLECSNRTECNWQLDSQTDRLIYTRGPKNKKLSRQVNKYLQKL